MRAWRVVWEPEQGAGRFGARAKERELDWPMQLGWGAGKSTACRRAGGLQTKGSRALSPKAVGWQNPFFFRIQKLKRQS